MKTFFDFVEEMNEGISSNNMHKGDMTLLDLHPDHKPGGQIKPEHILDKHEFDVYTHENKSALHDVRVSRKTGQKTYHKNNSSIPVEKNKIHSAIERHFSLNESANKMVHKIGTVEVHQSKHPFSHEPTGPKHQYNIVTHGNGEENWDHTVFDDKEAAIKHANHLHNTMTESVAKKELLKKGLKKARKNKEK